MAVRADTHPVSLRKHLGAILGAVAIGLQLPLLLTLFVFRDAFSFGTSFALALLAPYLGIVGLVLGLGKRSRLAIALSGLSLGGAAGFILLIWAIAAALGQG